MYKLIEMLLIQMAEIKQVPALKDDIPCEFCEQLIKHLRDVLVANTTEKEFEQVLLGLCGATKSFKKEVTDLFAGTIISNCCKFEFS